ncbi:kinase-like protein [Pseudovirgaria hyperparasitica]|uniref:non-specific serine/threonine protein kinase n=1 Tax=Pseudovirgaria hyperparasitica TaxID=470096 RepID=A0A6A6WN39_9PEZI|nr:kinase-like protein [Pseudovirgaria hyperparasitica]KAF2763459.1 kinase-like protein [Pseudovirgaria hyperparasitica]
MENLAIKGEAVEDGLSTLFYSLCITPDAKSLDEAFFDKIRSLLLSAGKLEWSKRPRSYTVLRLIDRVDAMKRLILEGCLDLHFPYSDSAVPEPLRASSVRFKFLDAQRLVLTKAASMETEKGRHAHFNCDANAHFHILNPLLGRGAFGVVDHVRSKLSLNEFARKKISRARTFARDKAAMRMFENELRNLRRLRHPHLVELVGSYTDPRFIGLLMSPVADTNLKVFLDMNQAPTMAEKAPLIRQFVGCLAGAVSYLHSQQCRHKDIKPSNILIKGDHVLLTDFGTARDWSDRTRGTTTGPTGPYTPGYASPEVVDQAPRGEPSDIWSLGCVYLDMLTVLESDTFAQRNAFFESHGTGLTLVRSNYDAFSLYIDQLGGTNAQDGALSGWIRRMLRPNPSKRISASELFAQIQEEVTVHHYYGECCFDAGYSTDHSDVSSAFVDETAVSLQTPTSHDRSGEGDKQQFTGVYGYESTESLGLTSKSDDREPDSISSRCLHKDEEKDVMAEMQTASLSPSISDTIQPPLPQLSCSATSPSRFFIRQSEREKHSYQRTDTDYSIPPLPDIGAEDGQEYRTSIIRMPHVEELFTHRIYSNSLQNLRNELAFAFLPALRANSSFPAFLYLERSLLDLCNNRYKSAEMHALGAVSQDPMRARPWLYVAESRMAMNNMTGALGAYQRAVELCNAESKQGLLDALQKARTSIRRSMKQTAKVTCETVPNGDSTDSTSDRNEEVVNAEQYYNWRARKDKPKSNRGVYERSDLETSASPDKRPRPRVTKPRGRRQRVDGFGQVVNQGADSESSGSSTKCHTGHSLVRGVQPSKGTRPIATTYDYDTTQFQPWFDPGASPQPQEQRLRFPFYPLPTVDLPEIGSYNSIKVDADAHRSSQYRLR